jgi:hypothetical protein
VKCPVGEIGTFEGDGLACIDTALRALTVIDGQSRAVLEGRDRNVVVVSISENRRIWVEAGNDWVPEGRGHRSEEDKAEGFQRQPLDDGI